MLRDSEERFREFVEASFDAVLVSDGARIVEVNDKWLQLYGYERHELKNLKVYDLVAHENIELVANAIQESAEGSWQFDNLRKDGSKFLVEAYAKPFVQRGREYRMVAVRDISERLRLENALRESEQKFRDFAQISSDWFWETDMEQRYTYVSVGIGPRHFSEAVPQLIGKTRHEWFADNAANEERVNRIQEAMGRGEQFQNIEFEIVCDSRRTWLQLSGLPVRDPAGRIFAYRGTATEITQRKLAEEELRRALNAAEHANRAKTQFLARASHDLRQPVHALEMLNAVLMERVTDPSLSTPVHSMGHAVAATKNVLDALFDISRMEAGAIEPVVSDIAVSEFLDHVLGESWPDARAKGLELVVVPSSAFVRTDPILLERVLNNLVSNAIRYTRSGKILIGCRRRDEGLEIQVWDTGVGIPEDQRDKVFEEYHQIGGPAQAGGTGHGLGLAIVKHIARLLGLPIGVRSSLGRGSMFSITVPLGSRDAGPNPVETFLGTALKLTGKTVLIVDDHWEAGNATASLLRHWGANVALALGAEEALRKISDDAFKPDLVITDYWLSDGASGIDVLRPMNKRLGVDVPTIVITGDTSPEITDAATKAGIEVLHKPVSPGNLRTLLVNLLRAKA